MMNTMIDYLPSVIDKITKLIKVLTNSNINTLAIIISSIAILLIIVNSNMFSITLLIIIVVTIYLTYKYMNGKVNNSEKFDKWTYLHEECKNDKANPLCQQYNEAYSIFENITDKMVNRFR